MAKKAKRGVTGGVTPKIARFSPPETIAKTMENCQELILEDVIRIDIYKQNKVTFSVPFNAPAVIEAEGVASGNPVLSIHTSETDAADVMMESAPKLQVTEKREAAGLVRSHVIEAVVATHFKTAQASVDNLIYRDIVAIMTCYDGTRLAVIPFPNTSTLSMTDNRQESHTMTVRYAAQSFSGLVKLTSWSQDSSSSTSSD